MPKAPPFITWIGDLNGNVIVETRDLPAARNRLRREAHNKGHVLVAWHPLSDKLPPELRTRFALTSYCPRCDQNVYHEQVGSDRVRFVTGTMLKSFCTGGKL